MRTILTIILIICCLTGLTQNSYKTIKVEGCVQNMVSPSCLKKGDLLKGDETLRFDKPGSFAVLVSSVGEVVTVKVQDTTKNKTESGFNFTFAEVVRTAKGTEGETSTRGVANQQVTNFRDFLGEGRFTVIGDEARFGVSPRIYPVSKDKFLVLHYTLDTFKVSKRLGFRDQVIRFQKNRLTEIDGVDFDRSKIEGVNLYYYEVATKSTERIATFDLVFITPDQLISDFDEVYNTLPEKDKQKPQDLAKVLNAFFNSFYGKTEPQSLQFIIDEYVGRVFKK